MYTVDEGLHGRNVLQAVVVYRICYVYAQDQFASYQQCGNEPLRYHQE